MKNDMVVWHSSFGIFCGPLTPQDSNRCLMVTDDWNYQRGFAVLPNPCHCQDYDWSMSPLSLQCIAQLSLAHPFTQGLHECTLSLALSLPPSPSFSSSVSISISLPSSFSLSLSLSHTHTHTHSSHSLGGGSSSAAPPGLADYSQVDKLGLR